MQLDHRQIALGRLLRSRAANIFIAAPVVQSGNVMNMVPTTVCHFNANIYVFFVLGIGAVIMKLQEFKHDGHMHTVVIFCAAFTVRSGVQRSLHAHKKRD